MKKKICGPKMNPKLKKKWIDALRSGKFKQGTGKLQRDNQGITIYCCLGVLCKVSRTKAEWEGYGTLHNVELRNQKWKNLRDRFGLTNGQESRLITMNDDDHDNFETIADYIEKNIK